MKTRTDTGMSRIRLAGLALLAALLLTIAWPLNISAQVSSSYGNWQRNGRVKDFGKPGADDFGGKNGGGLLNNENNEYNLPSYWLWDECYTVLVRNANLSFSGLGTTLAEAEGPAFGKLPIGYFISKELPIREDLQTLGFPYGGIPPHLTSDGTTSTTGAFEDIPPFLAIDGPGDLVNIKADISDDVVSYNSTPGNSNQFFATKSGTNEDAFIVCNGDGTKVIGTRFNSNTVGNNQEGNLRPWQPVKINGVPSPSPVLALLRSALDNLGAPDNFAAPFSNTDDVDDYRWAYLHRIEFDHLLGNPFVAPILNPDGPLVSNLPPIEIGLLIGQIEVALQNPKLKEDERKKLEDLLKKLKAKRDKPTGLAPTDGSQVEVNKDGNNGTVTVGNDQVLDYPPGQPVDKNTWPYTSSRDKLPKNFWKVRTSTGWAHLGSSQAAVISSDQGIAHINFDGSSVVFPNQGGMKKYTNNGDETTFWFFDTDNIEMVVKALDGRTNNGIFWLFSGKLTNVSFEMRVTDTETGLVRTYGTPISSGFEPITDTDAFRN